jgi:plasmid stability protein
MRRTQIYLDEDLDEQLRQRAAAEGRSAAALIREVLRAYLAGNTGDDEEGDPIMAMVGALRGLPPDASVEHDRDLYGGHATARGATGNR